MSPATRPDTGTATVERLNALRNREMDMWAHVCWAGWILGLAGLPCWIYQAEFAQRIEGALMVVVAFFGSFLSVYPAMLALDLGGGADNIWATLSIFMAFSAFHWQWVYRVGHGFHRINGREGFILPILLMMAISLLSFASSVSAYALFLPLVAYAAIEIYVDHHARRIWQKYVDEVAKDENLSLVALSQIPASDELPDLAPAESLEFSDTDLIPVDSVVERQYRDLGIWKRVCVVGFLGAPVASLALYLYETLTGGRGGLFFVPDYLMRAMTFYPAALVEYTRQLFANHLAAHSYANLILLLLFLVLSLFQWHSLYTVGNALYRIRGRSGLIPVALAPFGLSLVGALAVLSHNVFLLVAPLVFCLPFEIYVHYQARKFVLA